MTYATATSARRGHRYREMEVLSATPGELVVMVYDHLLACLLRARAAIAQKDHETRATEFGRARDAVCELIATLDRSRGGEVASQLAGLYNFFLREITAISTDQTVDRLDRVTQMVRELREAFVGIQPGAAR